jgi:nucleoside-diphosphate-sugar epimerase
LPEAGYIRGKIMSELRPVIVTGGAGFIGSHLVKMLAKREYKIYALYNIEQAVHKVTAGKYRLT